MSDVEHLPGSVACQEARERRHSPASRAGRVVPVALIGWLAFWAVVRQPHGGSWGFFVQGSHVLLHSGPLGWTALYATHPKLQIGPLAFLAGLPFGALPPTVAKYAAITLMTALGIPLFALLCSMIDPRARHRLVTIGMAGLAAAPVWVEVATRAGHLDDVLALAFGVTALAARLRGHHTVTALLCAAAADSKPWALAFAPLFLDVDRPLREQVRPLLVLMAGLALAWGPFVLGDPQTIRAARFTIRTSAGSALHAIGVQARRTPLWDRPAQIVLGGALAGLAMLRRRPGVVLLLAVCARLLLDPETYPYYTSGLLVAAVAFDVLRSAPRAFPAMTTAVILVIYIPQYVLPGHSVLGFSGYPLAGDLRAVFCVLAPLVALALPRSEHLPVIVRSPRSRSAGESSNSESVRGIRRHTGMS